MSADTFVLPPNWYINIDDTNIAFLENYANKHKPTTSRSGGSRGRWRLKVGMICGMVHSNATGLINFGVNPGGLTASIGKYGYDFGSQITTAQFLKYVYTEHHVENDVDTITKLLNKIKQNVRNTKIIKGAM